MANFNDVAILARRLMEEFGVRYDFCFNKRKRDIGLCRFPGDPKAPNGRIELSTDYVANSDMSDIDDTIRHEIAHAIAARQGEFRHGPAWKEACLLTGAKPNRLSTYIPKGKLKATCPSCGTEFVRHRRPRSGTEVWCRACGRENGKLEYRKTG